MIDRERNVIHREREENEEARQRPKSRSISRDRIDREEFLEDHQSLDDRLAIAQYRRESMSAHEHNDSLLDFAQHLLVASSPAGEPQTEDGASNGTRRLSRARMEDVSAVEWKPNSSEPQFHHVDNLADVAKVERRLSRERIDREEEFGHRLSAESAPPAEEQTDARRMLGSRRLSRARMEDATGISWPPAAESGATAALPTFETHVEPIRLGASRRISRERIDREELLVAKD